MIAVIWAFLGTGIGRVVGGVIGTAVVMIGLYAWSAITEWRVARSYQRGALVVAEAVKKRDQVVDELEKRTARDAAEIEAMKRKMGMSDASGAAADWTAELDRVLDATRTPEP